MSAKAKELQDRPRYRNLLHGLALPISYLDIFAYLRFGGSADVDDAFRDGPIRLKHRKAPDDG